MIEGLLITLAAGLAIVLGVVLAHFVGRRLVGWRELRQERLEMRGAVYSSDMALRISLLPVWAGGAFAGLSLMPAVAWLATGDGGARRVFLGMFVVSMIIFLAGVASAFASMAIFVREADRVTRVSAFRERSIRFVDVERIDEGPVFPAVRLHTATQRLRVPKTIAGFDDLFNQLAANVGDVLDDTASDSTQPTELAPITETATYAVSSRRIGINLGILGALFLFAIGWPWFVNIAGDHPTRDAFIFMGIGLALWLGIAVMVRGETFPPGQPVALRLEPDRVAWRTLRDSWVERPREDLVSASVETTIIYVKGQPGHRYPLRLRFNDDVVVEIDDFRARHLGSSTHLLGHDIRRRYVTSANRTSEHYEHALANLEVARKAEAAGDVLTAVASYRRAIGLWPNKGHLSLLGHVGELLWLHSRTVDNTGSAGRKTHSKVRAEAVGHYRAHLDFFPEDADAWQALGALLSGGHRTDLADEAISTAEQLLLSGRHKPAVQR